MLQFACHGGDENRWIIRDGYRRANSTVRNPRVDCSFYQRIIPTLSRVTRWKGKEETRLMNTEKDKEQEYVRAKSGSSWR